MACDICGDNKSSLNQLVDRYSTEQIRQICPECERDINKVLSNARSFFLDQLPPLIKAFARKKRARRIIKEQSND